MSPEQKRNIAIAVGLGATLGVGLMHEVFPRLANAVTTPFGIVYFYQHPSEDTIRHEQCHEERLKEVGVWEFYTDYFRNPAIEEARCGGPDVVIFEK